MAASASDTVLLQNISVNDDNFFIRDGTDSTYNVRFAIPTLSEDVTVTFPTSDTTLGSATSIAADSIDPGTGSVSIASGSGETIGIGNINAGDISIDSGGEISLDSGAASNFSTTVGALTLDGAAGVTIEGNSNTIDINGGDIDIDGAAITLDGSAASNFTTSGGALTLDGATGVNITGNSSEIDLTTLGDIDINGAAIYVDGTSLSLDGTTDSNFTMTANDASTKTLTISATNGHSSGYGVVNISATDGVSFQGSHFFNIDIDTSAITAKTFDYKLTASNHSYYAILYIVCQNKSTVGSPVSFSHVEKCLLHTSNAAQSAAIVGANSTEEKGTSQGTVAISAETSSADYLRVTITPDASDSMIWNGFLQIVTNDADVVLYATA